MGEPINKYGIMTWYRYTFIANIGAALQAYALQKAVINITGEMCEVINYKQDFGSDVAVKLSLRQRIRRLTFRKAISSLRERYKAYKMKPIMEERHNSLHDFINEHINESRFYSNKEDLIAAADEYSCFISGSDQIWSSYSLDTAFLLDFAKDKKRIAYSSSLGGAEMPREMLDTYREHLSKFSAISLREKTGVETIKSIIDSVPVEHVCDPVLLLTADEWSELAEINMCENEPYIFCYFLGDRAHLYDMIDQIAVKNGYKVKCCLYADAYKKIRNRNWETIFWMQPERFIEQVKNAQFVITDSFHGSAFSFVFQKECYIISPYAGDPRFDYIADELSVDESIYRIDNEDDFKAFELRRKKYKEKLFTINRNVERFRDKSVQYLVNALLMKVLRPECQD